MTIYKAYKGRWEIETLFDMYKNIIDRAIVGLYDDHRLYSTELVNFLTMIIATGIKIMWPLPGRLQNTPD